MRGFITLVLILACAAVARADTVKARELYQRATRAYNLQKFDQALTLFQQAYEEKDDPAILFNIGQCQRQLDQFDAAARSYRAYLTQAPQAPNRADVEARIGEMERLAREQAANRPATGAAPPLTASPAPIAPPPASAVVMSAPPSRGSRTLRLAGLGAGTGGVALLVLGGVFAGLSKSAGDDAYRGPVYDYAADQRQKNLRAADIACFTIGGAAVVAGVTLYALGARR
jgi:tetratricopeptide (TPR) repeat protein